MSSLDQIEMINSKLLAFLAKEQNEDGNFGSHASTAKELEGAPKYPSFFSTPLIQLCLISFPESATTKTIINKIVRYILKQKSDHWSFNYWTRNSAEAEKMPYPDDLDDTFCALSALTASNRSTLDGEAFAKIVMLLTALEQNEGGPYRTWLVPPNSAKVWQDVDIAVNSNIAYFMSLNDISLPNLEHYISSAIEKRKFNSPYYTSEFPIVYFISRFYKGPKTNKLIDWIKSNQMDSGTWGNLLNDSLMLAALINLRVAVSELEPTYDNLVSQWQTATKPFPFYYGAKIGPGGKHYTGSGALTAAFYLQAINLFAQKQKSVKQIKLSYETDAIKTAIVAQVKQRFGKLDPVLRAETDKFLARKNATRMFDQITLLPYIIYRSLKHKPKINHSTLLKLGTANLFGWIAYDIYDDFLDVEGDPAMLPIANICLRELTSIYSSLPHHGKFLNIFTEIIDKMENTNFREVTNCRLDQNNIGQFTFSKLPKLDSLGDRSIGHALPALYLFSCLETDHQTEDLHLIKSFFTDYLSARQINDDMHDWKDDLRKGQLTSVNIALLKKWTGLHPHERTISKKLLEQLDSIFWHDIVKSSCTQAKKLLNQARDGLKKLSPKLSPELIEELILRPLDQSIAKTVKEQKEAILFLKAYSEQ